MNHELPGMSIAHQTHEAALSALGSSWQGLTGQEVKRRLAEFGPNQVEATAREPLWLMLLREFSHFFALILWLAAGLAFLAEHFEPGQGMAELGLAIVGVIVVNGCFSFWQAYRAEQALDALRQLLPQRVNVRREAHVADVDAAELVPGDVVLLAEGSKVPADCRILESWGIRVNLATLTGESRPKARSTEVDAALANDPLSARSLLLAGTLIVAGECSAVVYATGMRTEFGRIAHLTQTVGETESPLQKEIRRVSRLVALLALGLGVLFFAIGHFVGLPLLGQFHVRHRHHRRQRTGRPAAHGDLVAGAGDAAHGQAQRAGTPPAGGRDAGQRHGDPHRQDRHADAEPHDGARIIRLRPPSPGRKALAARP